MSSSKPRFKVGQQVYVYGRGNGVVVAVGEKSVTVWFSNDYHRTFFDTVDIEVLPEDDTAGVA